jgi:hypothetical protein
LSGNINILDRHGIELKYALINFKIMIGKYKIITLCGSTKFKDEFIAEQKRLTMEGNIVISVGLFGHSGDLEVWSERTKEMLDDMHKRKIDLADEIFVINPGGYLGQSTISEIEYAKKTNKLVKYLKTPEGIN